MCRQFWLRGDPSFRPRERVVYHMVVNDAAHDCAAIHEVEQERCARRQRSRSPEDRSCEIILELDSSKPPRFVIERFEMFGMLVPAEMRQPADPSFCDHSQERALRF